MRSPISWRSEIDPTLPRRRAGSCKEPGMTTSATTLQPDVSVKWLRAVKSKVTGLGAVTDGDEEAVAGILSNTGLEGLFDSVTTSERVRSYKPDPKIFRVALKSLRAKPSESLFVSDA